MTVLCVHKKIFFFSLKCGFVRTKSYEKPSFGVGRIWTRSATLCCIVGTLSN